MLNKTSNVCVT